METNQEHIKPIKINEFDQITYERKSEQHSSYQHKSADLKQFNHMKQTITHRTNTMGKSRPNQNTWNKTKHCNTLKQVRRRQSKSQHIKQIRTSRKQS